MKEDEILVEWAESEFNNSMFKELKSQYSSSEKLKLAERIVHESAKLKIPPSISNDELWSKIESKIAVNKNHSLKWWSMAASVALVFGIWSLFKVVDQQAYYADIGEINEVKLPDGSLVIMNSFSEIRLNQNWNEARSLHLDGEAFFEIVKGDDLTIETSNGNITVLGTSFNVKSRKEYFEVICKSGKVRVDINDFSTVLLKGEGAISEGGEIRKFEMDSARIGSWTTGITYFRNVRFSECMEELGRQYGYTTVASDKTKSLRYNGFFEREKLMDALNSICLPLGVTFSINEKEKTINFYN